MIVLEFTPEQLRALLDADFSSPDYPLAVAKCEQALLVEEGSCGDNELHTRERPRPEARDRDSEREAGPQTPPRHLPSHGPPLGGI